MTPPRAEGYLGFLATTYLPAYYEDPFNVTLYNGSTALGEITAAQLKGVISAKGYAWINIDVANGGTYTSAVFSSPGITGVVFDISYGTATESLTALTGPVGAPLPALAGTIPGFAVAVLGMLGLRRRGRRA